MNGNLPLRHFTQPSPRRLATLDVLIPGAGLTSSCIQQVVEVTRNE
jgi:hypothetical protein